MTALHIKFENGELEKHCERVMSIMTKLPQGLRCVCALMDAYGWFKLVEGEESPKVREALRHLVSPELRYSLKEWYMQFSSINPSAEELRKLLEKSAGEKLLLKNEA